MTTQRLTREDLVEQSINDYAKATIFTTLGYSPGDVEMLESFPYEMENLSKTYVAAGVHFDDGGKQAELGSPMKVRYYTVEFYVIGLTLTWARNVANQLKESFEGDQMVPLKDYTQSGFPVIDQLLVDDNPGFSATRQYVPQPESWQRFIYMTHGRLYDYYDGRFS